MEQSVICTAAARPTAGMKEAVLSSSNDSAKIFSKI